MFRKILFYFFFLIIFTNKSYSQINYKIITTVNNQPITQIDLDREIEIIRILNKTKNISKLELSIPLTNLIDEKIKFQEIEKEKKTLDKKEINYLFNILIKNLNLNINDLDNEIIDIIKNKIKIDRLWNNLMIEKFSRKININMQEIENKIQNIKVNDQEEKEKIKEKLIIEEKNKKLVILSKNYFNKIKQESLIKNF